MLVFDEKNTYGVKYSEREFVKAGFAAVPEELDKAMSKLVEELLKVFEGTCP